MGSAGWVVWQRYTHLGGRRPVPPRPRPLGVQETEGKPRHRRGLALAEKDS